MTSQAPAAAPVRSKVQASCSGETVVTLKAFIMPLPDFFNTIQAPFWKL